MRSSTLRLIASKELLDTLRDRRTLFVSLVLPLLLYPTLLLCLTQIIGSTQRDLRNDHQRVVVVGDVTDELRKSLVDEKLGLVDAEVEQTGLTAELRGHLADMEGGKDPEGGRGRLREALASRHLSGAVVLKEGFRGLVQSDRQGRAVLLYDPTDEAGKMAYEKMRLAFEKFEALCRMRLLDRFQHEEDRLRFAEAPVVRARIEVASSTQKGAYSFAPLLGMLIVMMALTGAFYPAVDLAAGEKERGTLETLLVAPVTRTEIVLGKFVAVWVIAVVTALLNLLAMALTFSKVAGMIGGGVAFQLSLPAAATVCAILIPTAALFGAIALALSSFATSYKEGQHYMSPLFLVATPLAMVGLLPNVEITYGLAAVPVANVVLLVKAMLRETDAAGPALVAFAAMAFYAGLALWFSIAAFRRETILFRAGAGRGFDPKSLLAAREGLPREGQGFLLYFVVLALMFFLAALKVDTAGDAVRAFFKGQLAAVLLPTVVLAVALRLDLRRTFALRAPPLKSIPLVIAAALATMLPILAFQAYVMPERKAGGFEQVVEKLVLELPHWQLLLLAAVLPPICEELLCRGFLFSSFRARFGDRGAVVLTAVLFGILHLDPWRVPATAMAGLALGLVRLRTGSVFAPILFHVVYNGTLFDLATGEGWIQKGLARCGITVTVEGVQRFLERPPLLAVAAALAVLAGCAYGLLRAAPREEPARVDNP